MGLLPSRHERGCKVRPGIEGAIATVYVVMKGKIEKNPRHDHKLGKIVSIWDTQEHALDEIDWFIDKEISVSGNQLNDYWVQPRGVLTMRQDFVVGN